MDNQVVMHAGMVERLCADNERLESRIAEARAIFERFDRGELYDTDAFQALRALLGPKSESREEHG